MIYLVFDSVNKKLFYRDDLTSLVDRLTLDVKTFQRTESAYIFELEPHQKFQYKYIYSPVQNTMLSII